MFESVSRSDSDVGNSRFPRLYHSWNRNIILGFRHVKVKICYSRISNIIYNVYGLRAWNLMVSSNDSRFGKLYTTMIIISTSYWVHKFRSHRLTCYTVMILLSNNLSELRLCVNQLEGNTKQQYCPRKCRILQISTLVRDKFKLKKITHIEVLHK
jgi:hypothetical protein